jgi:hypothetical protein
LPKCLELVLQIIHLQSTHVFQSTIKVEPMKHLIAEMNDFGFITCMVGYQPDDQHMHSPLLWAPQLIHTVLGNNHLCK